jgi:LmbE family N-acetylglucosaminyl deacetylase
MIKKILKLLYYTLKQTILKLHLKKVLVNNINEYKNILIIAPHPDDEILGLGGFIIQQLKRNAKIYILYITDGELSLEDIKKDIIANARINISDNIIKKLGIQQKNIFRLHLNDGNIPRKGYKTFNECMYLIQNIIKSVNPDVVFATHPLETWPIDHVSVYELTKEAVKNINRNIKLYGYWVWLPYSIKIKNLYKIDFHNTIKIDIKNVIQNKKQLIDLYLLPKSPNGNPWSGNLPKEMLKSFKYPYEIVTSECIKKNKHYK